MPENRHTAARLKSSVRSEIFIASGFNPGYKKNTLPVLAGFLPHGKQKS